VVPAEGSEDWKYQRSVHRHGKVSGRPVYASHGDLGAGDDADQVKNARAKFDVEECAASRRQTVTASMLIVSDNSIVNLSRV
jgi:hypothetical protein